MGTLKISVAAVESNFEVKVYNINYSIGIGVPTSSNYPTYELAKTTFGSILFDGILFCFNKTDAEIATIKSNNSKKIIVHIIGTYNNTIKSVKCSIRYNNYYFPNGDFDTYPDKSVASSTVIGIGGELYNDNRTSPQGVSSSVVVSPVTTITDGLVVPIKFTFYHLIELLEGFKASGQRATVELEFVDGSGTSITTYIYNTGTSTWVPRTVITNSVFVRSDPLEKTYDISKQTTITLNDLSFDILEDTSGTYSYIKIESLSSFGVLKYKGNNVTLHQSITREDIANGYLTYTNTSGNDGDRDFISYIRYTSLTGGGSSGVYRVIYLTLVTPN